MVILRNVSKRFGNTLAVDDISVEITQGQVVGLLGENGAGKTTLMNLLCGYLPASAGEILVDGHDMLLEPVAAHSAIGYMPEQVPLYPELTVKEYLDFCCALKQIPPEQRLDASRNAAETAGIGQAFHLRIGTLSKGMKQRVGFAQALCGNPPLLLLDEPTAGFDPAQAADFRALVKSLRDKHTVIVSSHILSEIEAMCDRVCIIKSGRLVYDQRVSWPVAQDTLTIRIVVSGDAAGFLPALRALPSVHTAAKDDGPMPGQTAVSVVVHDAQAFGQALACLVSGMGLSLLSMRPAERTLEDVFLQVSRGRHTEDKP